MTAEVPTEDLKIISLFRSGKQQDREQAFRVLYRKMYKKAVGWIINQSGNEEQARTAFNIALMRLEQKVVPGSFELNSSLGSFLMGILRLVWLEERRKVVNYTELDPQRHDQQDDDSDIDKQQLEQALRNCLNKLGEDCKRLLFYKYWLNLNMKEIATRMGFSGDNAAYSAANKKNKCMKKLVVECDQSQLLNL